MKLLSILLVITLLPLQTLALCKEPVRLLDVGEKAPCTGFLFSPEAEKQAAQDHSDLIFYKDLNKRLEKRKELTDKEINILDKRLQLYIDQSGILAERLHEKEKQSKWEKVLWFSLGIVVTGLAVSGAKRL